MFRISTFLKLSLALSPALLAACTSEQKPAGEQTAPSGAPSATAAPAATGGPLTPDPEIHANRGDVVRYTLKVGVHNVHFLADSNAGRSGFPQAPSDFLQLPGQTWDLAVKMPAGKYYFQCDPHAALGMKGHLIVH